MYFTLTYQALPLSWTDFLSFSVERLTIFLELYDRQKEFEKQSVK